MGHSIYDLGFKDRRPWNAGRKLGAKRPLRQQQVWAIRFWLDREQRLRDRALFDLAIDSKLRGCDVVKVKIGDLVNGGRVRSRAIAVQKKIGRPVQFELLEPARSSMVAWLERRGGSLDDFVFPSRIDHADHISTRQYAGSAATAYSCALLVHSLGTSITEHLARVRQLPAGFCRVLADRCRELSVPRGGAE